MQLKDVIDAKLCLLLRSYGLLFLPVHGLSSPDQQTFITLSGRSFLDLGVEFLSLGIVGILGWMIL